MEREELTAWLRLLSTPGLGSANSRHLLAAFGLPQEVLCQPLTALQQVVGPTLARALQEIPSTLAADVERTWAWLQEAPHERALVPLGDPRYPSALLEIEDPPVLLYMQGRLENRLDDRRTIAIVGSRNPTPQGLLNARAFARALSDAGLTIVSGLALGIDGAAHEGALAAGAPSERLATVAVVGTGLDRVYPRRHHALAHQIAHHGLLISEYPLGTPPLAPHFPRRNRLIAGLSRATLVVEAALGSGSLITARLAAEQGREVMAIPGSIHSPQARGCHALIRQGAKLVETAQDVLDEMPDLRPSGTARVTAPPVDDAEHTDALLEAMGYEPLSLDALQARTGLDTAALQARLMALELEERVTRLPGGLLQRLVRT